MKKNRLRCTLFLTFLTILMLLTMSVSAQAAGVKTPGKVTVTRVRLTGSNNVTVYWKKAKNATNYRIYYKQAGAKSWKGIAINIPVAPTPTTVPTPTPLTGRH